MPNPIGTKLSSVDWKGQADKTLTAASKFVAGDNNGAAQKPDNFVSSYANQNPTTARFIGAGVLAGAVVVSSVADGVLGFGASALFGGVIGLTAASRFGADKKQGLIAAAAGAGICAIAPAVGISGTIPFLVKFAAGAAVGAAVPQMYANGQYEQYYR